MATNKAKTSAPKLAAPKAVDTAEKSSVTAVAASAAAVGAAGGVNPGTNSPDVQKAAAPTPAAAAAAEQEKVAAVTPAGTDAAQTPAAQIDGETKPAAAPPAGWVITCLRRDRGIWRAGRFWPPEPTLVEAGELTSAQLEQLRGEKLLLVNAGG